MIRYKNTDFSEVSGTFSRLGASGRCQRGTGSCSSFRALYAPCAGNGAAPRVALRSLNVRSGALSARCAKGTLTWTQHCWWRLCIADVSLRSTFGEADQACALLHCAMTGSGRAREINNVEISSQPWIGLARAARSWNVILARRGGREACERRAHGAHVGKSVQDESIGVRAGLQDRKIDALRMSASSRISLRLADSSVVSLASTSYGWNLHPRCTMTVCCHQLVANVQPSVERNRSPSPRVAGRREYCAGPDGDPESDPARVVQARAFFFPSPHASCSSILPYICLPQDRPSACQKQPSEYRVSERVRQPT